MPRRMGVSSLVVSILLVLTVACSGGGGGGSAPVTPPPPAMDLSVDSWYITQSSQTYSGSVPLVANRDGFLRIFVKANLANDAVPVVRVTLDSGSPVDIPAPSGVTALSGVPTAVSEGNLNLSWNLIIAGAAIHTGMTVKIELDPQDLIVEGNEANNLVDATPVVQTAKVFPITLVPVVQSTLTGNVTTGRTLGSWMDRFQRMYPIANGGIDVLQRSSALTTTANLNTGSTSNPGGASQTGWAQLLGELEALRVGEASSRYYYGVVNVSYGSGIAGLGYVGLPSALGWDKTGYSDGGNYPEILAHEVGHNLDQSHANCGNPTGIDPFWLTAPASYANGAIGVYGYDVANSALKAPSAYKDIMAYCSPVWVSDFTYRNIMDFRAGGGLRVVEPAAVAQDCLLVWGTVKNGQVTLEPAFRMVVVPQPPTPGSYTLQLRDAQEGSVSETSFEPVAVADLPGEPESHFAFTVPVSSDGGQPEGPAGRGPKGRAGTYGGRGGGSHLRRARAGIGAHAGGRGAPGLGSHGPSQGPGAGPAHPRDHRLRHRRFHGHRHGCRRAGRDLLRRREQHPEAPEGAVGRIRCSRKHRWPRSGLLAFPSSLLKNLYKIDQQG